jgi:hypothetical protein
MGNGHRPPPGAVVTAAGTMTAVAAGDRTRERLAAPGIGLPRAAPS